MRYISTFSGVEAATLAWEPMGWHAVAFSEIDPFPSAVLAARWPEVPNLGDITKVDWGEYRGTIDVIVGGSPCQSFSVAGGRAGLDGESGLMFEYIRAIRDVRPRWLVWENVPGVFSIDRGRAFGTLLHELEKLGYGMAWRVLDAQFFGVAQRRRRVFVVGSTGGAGRAAAVLFEPESMRGDHPTSRAKREALAAGSRGGAPGGRGALGVGAPPMYSCNLHAISEEADVSGTLQAKANSLNSNPLVAFAQNTRDEVRLIGGDGQTAGALSASPGMKQQTYIAQGPDLGVGRVRRHGDDGADAEIAEDVAPTVLSRSYKGPPIVAKPEPAAYAVRTANTSANGAGVQADLAHTVDTNQPEAVAFKYAAGAAARTMPAYSDGSVNTLTADWHAPAVAYRPEVPPYVLKLRHTGSSNGGRGGEGALVGEDVSFTLATNQDQTLFDAGASGYVVRRLTPRECERLQGMPDDHTRIAWRGKPAEECPDGPRYKAIGNSMAVPVMRWIGERIQLVDSLEV